VAPLKSAVAAILLLGAAGAALKAERYGRSEDLLEEERGRALAVFSAAGLALEGFEPLTLDGKTGFMVLSGAPCKQPLRVAVLDLSEETAPLLAAAAPDGATPLYVFGGRAALRPPSRFSVLLVRIERLFKPSSRLSTPLLAIEPPGCSLQAWPLWAQF
jgi:hypothetical protein